MDLLIDGIDALLTMLPPAEAPPATGSTQPQALAVRDGRIAWIGPSNAAPPAETTIDATGAVVMPGLVDCHTHLVWAGSRSEEWEQRLAGADYSAILEAGGGILSTVRHSRAASSDELTDLAVQRLDGMRARGVTTVEVKSGYGLDPESEVKLLRAALAAGERADMSVIATFLGAHTVPAEWRHDRASYVRQLVEEQIPAVAGLARFIDIYVDRGAFTVDEARTILAAGKRHGLIPRVHAEQVTHTGAAALAAQMGASSADHLEQLDADGIAAMAAAGTVAVLLPGAMLTLGDPPPPVAALREAGVPMAVATDLNPGTSAVHDLWACATFACWQMGLTVDEALRGITAHAARALCLEDRGVLRVGARADIIVVDPAPGEPAAGASLVQHLGANRLRARVRGGRLTTH